MGLREIVFDTESTGFYYNNGDRMIEIGCVELLDKKPTGKTFHSFCHPENAVMSEGAYNVHKISLEFLKDKPLFREIAQDFLNFIADSKLIAHNASFDMRFLNMELQRAGFDPLPNDRAIDTLYLARKKLPDLSNHKLDTLCQHFGVSLTEREEKGHGALLDSFILSDVYYALMVDREQKLFVDTKRKSNMQNIERPYREPRTFLINQKDVENHRQFIETMKDPLWKK